MSSAPATTTTAQPTKFAKLLKVVYPLAKGALVGGFGGNWHVPGSGFQAEQESQRQQQQFALQKQEMDVRNQMLAREMYNAQSQDAWRKAQAQRDADQGERWLALTEQGAKPKHRIESTDAGLMDIDEDTGQAKPVENMEPEKTGSLPMPNESEVAPLMPYQKPAVPKGTTAKPAPGFTLGQGQERFDASGKKIAEGAPKTFAPRSPRSGSGTTPKVDQADIESAASIIMQSNKNDANKALADIDKKEQQGIIKPQEAIALRARIREKARPGTSGRKIPAMTPDQMRQLTTAPPG